ncbi:putative nuclease HARBI1 isoform X2 [Dermacentor albipictus]|uniref:putative nuclease HARBI1 isoform X2 n=1 Tax=Dermacentor albipictus TaxID=60249 RepID=UPI0031FDEEDF
MDQRRALSAVVATLVTGILDSSSSSSSSDSEEELLLHELLSVANETHVLRLGECVEKALLKYSDEEFFQDFRIRRNVVLLLIERYAQSSFYVPRADHGGCPQKSPEEHILCFLWYATNKVCIKEVAIRFGISESTVHGITERLLDYLCSLLPKEICFPEDLDSLVDGFEQLADFPGVVGCIGGMRINTRSPAHSQRASASNGQGSASVILQAVCDSSCRFMDVFVGPPGDFELESVFLASPLAEELPYWCQDKYHLLGGGGYPLREYLLTPYDSNATDCAETPEMVFNKRHDKTRTKIADTFMLLRQRFKQLHFLEFVTANKMRRFIIACCVLHNLCVQAGDVELDFECLDTDSGFVSACSELDTEAEEEDERELGSLKRDKLAQSFIT